MKTKSSGFTLVELAIVLVIISLLMGGILKGQELINSAKVKNLANDFRAVSAAYYGYLDRFRAVPGDDKAATTHVGASKEGDGDGMIEGAWNATYNSEGSAQSESYIFWEHVRRAGLLSGSTSTNTTSYLPDNANGGRIGITGMNAATAGVGPITDSGYKATFFVCSGNINGRLAKQLDTMLDDGETSAGSMRAAKTEESSSVTTANMNDADLHTVCVAN